MNRPFRHQAPPTGPPVGARLVVATALVGVGAVALVACGAGPTQSGATTTTHPPDVSASVVRAYRGMWADLVTAARTSDFQSARLSQHTSGDALTLFVQGLARDQLHGIVTRGEPVLHPVVASLSPSASPTRAKVTDCFDDTHWVEYKTSGGLAKNAPGGRRATTADLKNVGGVWKVTSLSVGATGTC
jgi:hypothetical protein